MTTDVIFADTTDGHIQSGDSTPDWTKVRAGTGSIFSVNTSNTSVNVGSSTTNDLTWEAFFQFNTSVVGTDTVSSATFSLNGVTDNSVVDFIMEARASNWGVALTTADWIPGTSLGSLTLLAHYATSGGWAAGYHDFVDDAFAANVNGAGQTYVLVASDFQRTSSTAPPALMHVISASADTAGTTSDPKLTVIHVGAAGNPPYSEPYQQLVTQ